MEIQLALILIIAGTIGHLITRRSGDMADFFVNKYGRFNNRGEVATGTAAAGTAAGAGEGDGKGKGAGTGTFTQEQVNDIVAQRVARERAQFGDYDELRKFREEHNAAQEKLKQEELVKAKKFEEAQKGYETTITQHKDLIGKKDGEIRDLKIGYALAAEITAQNGYVEEVAAMIKASVEMDDKGVITIKSRDTNGLETKVPIAEGIKKFLTEKPHLVKSTHRAGAGSGAGEGAGAGGGQAGAQDLAALNAELVKAMNTGDLKKVAEIKAKIKSGLGDKGVVVG